jgi:epoxyqueuosine reductase
MTTDSAALTNLVYQAASRLGFDLVGVAQAGPSPDYAHFENWLAAGMAGDMAYLAQRAGERADLRVVWPEARSAIVLGANYFAATLPASLRDDPSRGLFAAYAWAEDYHNQLKPLLFELDAALRAATGRTTLGRAYVDSGPVLERSWAAVAGLGFIGKNTCLIAPELGSWLFLAVLLVPEELASGWQMAGSEIIDEQAPLSLVPRRLRVGTCGACARCLDVCPTGAFPAPRVLDARRCISYLTIELRGSIPLELRPAMGHWVFGCDLCQEVCPWNRRFARPARLAGRQPHPDVVAPKLLDLLALDEAGFRQRFRHSPVLRAKRRGLLRNVCVALGNWGDSAATPGLIEALHDAEPLIRGHAAWALGRIGADAAPRALVQRLKGESDLRVRREIAAALDAVHP